MSKKKSATKKSNNSQSKVKNRNNVAIWGLFFIVFIMTATLLGIFFLQKPTEEVSLDTRKAAMVQDGIVDLELYPFDQSTIKLGESQNIDFQLNTKDAALGYIELNLEVQADENLLDSSKIQFADEIPSTLEVVTEDINEISCDNKDCFTAKLVLESKDTAIPYTTNNESKTIAKLNFKPDKEGSFEIELMSTSKVTAIDSQDDLLAITNDKNFEFFVTENGIDPAQCYYDYSDWSACNDGWQSRTYEVLPNNCHWHEEEELEELSRTCYYTDTSLVTASSEDFYLSTSKTCWSSNNDGSDIIINWNADKYQNVTWVDMSNNYVFNNFFHKNVEGNSKDAGNGFLRIDATNLMSADNNDGPFVFEPGEDYYFRLYSEDGYHLLARRFETDYCESDNTTTSDNTSAKTVTYTYTRNYLPSEYYDLTTYSCNHGCNTNRDCDAGLRCYEGKCRSADNPTDNTCLVGKVIEENKDATAEAKVTETVVNNEEEPETNAFVERRGLNINSLWFGILSSFSWQWLALAGVILIISIALIVIGIARSKKDPWEDVKSFEQEEAAKKAFEEKRKVIIPENKPLEIEKEPETPPQMKR